MRVYPVGVGSPEGVVLELEGFQIPTQLNETVLPHIAETANDVYYHAEDEVSQQEICQDIDLQMTARGEEMNVTSIFAGGAAGGRPWGAGRTWWGSTPLSPARWSAPRSIW